MLEVNQLSKKYGKTLAVDHVSFTVPTGRVGILLGPNGAGKSTIIKSIAGLLRFQGGVRILGIPSREVEARRMFAYVPEIPAMYEALTIEEHFEFIIRAYGLNPDAAHAYAEELMRRFELSDKRDKLGNELSKGMMQKVSICCALLIRPKVILLDEPMVGLDPMAIKELKAVITELRDQGVTILISTHMLEMVKELWQDVFIMDKGHIIGHYTIEEAQDTDIEQLFLNSTGGEQYE